jgi:large subunit ribosomal protein L29
MEMKELRGLAEAELAEKEQQLTQELFNLRFQLATGRIENPMRIRQTRHDLARVKTLLRQHALVATAVTRGGKESKS